MGADPKTSVLNPWNQCWDVKNLFVMMAVTARACDYILDQHRRGNI